MFRIDCRTIVTTLSLFALQGCILVNGPLEVVEETNAPAVKYLPVGIPLLLGGHGTSVPITDELSLTAKHVAKIDFSDVVAFHPDCDVALIKQDNTNVSFPPLAKLNEKDALITVGKGLGGEILKGVGIYYLDVRFVDSDMFANCDASITDAPVQSGMSGGGVFKTNGELVGIISGISGSGFRLLDGRELGNERTSVFVSMQNIESWLATSIEAHYDKRIDELVAQEPAFTEQFFSQFIESSPTSE
ncbi:serine protease [Enterovibrio sp. ZSDZ35]|uniref:Serine protease n=1 Tax=Enterovibrio qingdaonensis TaxID=2899818 RepID=A0ABT5QNI5_9GAMM|nr:serine protease [Enterovibrio sp. ZSDZ35]MDD1782434.1 serine protease [Enterovibrio sp. ZSDZ35]